MNPDIFISHTSIFEDSGALNYWQLEGSFEMSVLKCCMLESNSNSIYTSSADIVPSCLMWRYIDVNFQSA